jgi:energy-coupling factor transport system permease protein
MTLARRAGGTAPNVEERPRASAWPDAARGAQATYHTRTWLLWFGTAGLAALLTRNPLYLALLALAARAVDAAVVAFEEARAPGAIDTRRGGWAGFLRLGLIMAGVSALFNGLGSHVGATVLARLPGEWPIIGGPLTLEGFAYGALAGCSLVVVLLVAATFNTGADTYALLRAIPAFLSQVGLVTAIGLAYVPQTITRAREIREAQILRGHRFRGPRSLAPLATPLLAGGLERAIQLAESMEARGFSAGEAPPAARRDRQPAVARALLTGGTALVALGAFAMLYFRQAPAGGAAALALGLALIGAALYRLGRMTRHTRYRREVLRRRDSRACAALALALALIGGAWVARAGAWNYSPYPALGWPDFDLVIGVALALLAAPAAPLLWDLRKGI